MKIPSLFFLVLSCAALAKPVDVKLLVDANYPPFSYVEGDDVKGLNNAILRKVAEQMTGYNIELVPKDWQDAKLAIKSGEFLGLAGVYFHGHDLYVPLFAAI